MSESSIHAENNERAFSPEAEQTAAGPESAVQNEAAAPLDIKRVASGLGNTQIPKIHRQFMAQTVGQQLGNKALQRMVGGGKNNTQVMRKANVDPAAGPEGGKMGEDLAGEWASANSKSGTPLPDNIREDFAAQGKSVDHVQVIESPSLLQRSGAKYASTQGNVHVPSVSSFLSDPEGVHHELEHAHQQSKSDPAPTAISSVNDAEEQHADHVGKSAGSAGSGGASVDGSVMTMREPSLMREASHAGETEEEHAAHSDKVMTMREPSLMREAAAPAEEEEGKLETMREPSLMREAEEEQHAGHDHSDDEGKLETMREPSLMREAEQASEEEEGGPAVQRMAEGEEHEDEEA